VLRAMCERKEEGKGKRVSVIYMLSSDVRVSIWKSELYQTENCSLSTEKTLLPIHELTLVHVKFM